MKKLDVCEVCKEEFNYPVYEHSNSEMYEVVPVCIPCLERLVVENQASFE